MANFGVSFADDADQYTFDYVQSFRHTFADAVPVTTRIPGMDGGFDHFGSEKAPAAIGQVNMTFDLVAFSKAEMQAKIDAVYALFRLGKQKLYFQPEGTANERWCYARVGNISVPRQPAEQTDLVQRVSISFQVPDPHWYEDETSTAIAASGVSTQDTVTNNGNAIALARIVIVPGSGHSCQDPIISRMVGATAEDQVSFAGTLSGTDELEINARQKSVNLNDAAAYSDFDFDHPDWIRLLPGDNTIKVEFDNSFDAATVTVYHRHTYR